MKDNIEIMDACIKHWGEVRDDPEKHKLGYMECPACQEYFKFGCFDCPIAKFTGKPNCKGTPYIMAKSIHEKIRFLNADVMVIWYNAANAEIDFLKDVRNNLILKRMEAQ